MKKFRKMIAGTLAAAVCAVSMTPFISNAAVYFPDVTPYTVSFTVNNETKYFLWEEFSNLWEFDEEIKKSQSFVDKDGKTATCYDLEMNVYGSETSSLIFGCLSRYYRYEDGTTSERHYTCPLDLAGYAFENENDKKTLESYLIDNNIPYVANDYLIEIRPKTSYDEMKAYMDIKENTGFVCLWYFLESPVSITDVENALPEKTLDGDANVDGKVDIADAAAIIQHIGNPAKYALTIQGEANADCYNTGDGITGMDAVAVQKLEAGLIESFDEA